MFRVLMGGALAMAWGCSEQRPIHLAVDDFADLDRGFACDEDSITLTNASATVRAQVSDSPFNDDPVRLVVFTGVDLINEFDDNLCDDVITTGRRYQVTDFAYTMTAGTVALIATDAGVRFEATEAVLTPDAAFDDLTEGNAADSGAVDVGNFASDIVVRAVVPQDTLPW